MSIRKLLVVAIVLLTFGAIFAQAQITDQMKFKMTQPFTVGNTTLPAGSYVIRNVSGSDHSMIEISGGKLSVMVQTDAINDPEKAGSHLVFNKYHNVLALTQVFPGNGAQGYQIEQGQPEKAAAKSEQPTKQSVPGRK